MSNGTIIYEGPSRLDGAPIVAIATGLHRDSENTKTGALIQTHIMRADIPPNIAIADGSDRSVCGGCQFASGGPCYVLAWRGPLTVWKTYQRGGYRAAPKLSAVSLGRGLRLGSYGDPAAVPWRVWRGVVAGADQTVGYTHQWRTTPRSMRAIAMASVDNPAEYHEAQAAGWRTFRVRRPEDPILPGEIVCPASKEGGKKTTCDNCNLCSGNSVRAPSIVTIVHGPKAARFNN